MNYESINSEDARTFIPAKPKINLTEKDRFFRVCAYCRVSTDKHDQRNSLQAQETFFASIFEKHPNWVNVGIFSDEGLSGTSLEKRENFNAMLRIALQGKTDIILTKDSSRRKPLTENPVQTTKSSPTTKIRPNMMQSRFGKFISASTIKH